MKEMIKQKAKYLNEFEELYEKWLNAPTVTSKIPKVSKEMYINMKPKDIPLWNSKRHFFEQEQSTVDFWLQELHKIQNGITIGGFFMHPWLYFHLNFFKTPEEGVVSTNELFFAEGLTQIINEENPYHYSKGLLIYGVSDTEKTLILASLAHWRTLTKFNSFGSIIGGSSSDLSALTSKVQTSMTFIEELIGIDTRSSIIFSTQVAQNSQQTCRPTAGLAPSVSIYDEIGKYPFLAGYLAALPSFKTPFGFKCMIVIHIANLEADLSADAMQVLGNPEAFDLLPMDFRLSGQLNNIEYIKETLSQNTFSRSNR